MEDFKLMITGDRSFKNYAFLENCVNALLFELKNSREIIIVSGMSKGANMLGEQYAAAYGYEVEEFGNDHKVTELLDPALYDQMGKISDACLCFWDGRCEDTRQIIEKINDMPPITIVVRYPRRAGAQILYPEIRAVS